MCALLHELKVFSRALQMGAYRFSPVSDKSYFINLIKGAISRSVHAYACACRAAILSPWIRITTQFANGTRGHCQRPGVE
jgi:hypothetical protein